MDVWEPVLPAVAFAIAISLFAAIAMSALCGWAPESDQAIKRTRDEANKRKSEQP